MALFSTMALKATLQGSGASLKYLGVINDGTQNQGHLEYSTNGVLSPNAKFAVENAHGNLVHIRSCLTNKYWVRSSTNGNWIVAQGAQPVGDKTSWTCTLFRMDIDDSKKVKFHHVQSGRTVCIPNDNSSRKMFLSIDPTANTQAVSFAVDYDTLVILPKYVAFKGSNGLYYRNESVDFNNRIPYDSMSCFCVKDIGEPDIVCETRYTNDGQLRLKAVNTSDKRKLDLFWSYNSLAEGEIVLAEDRPAEHKQMFDAIRLNNNVIALRSHGNNKFLKRTDLQRINFVRKDRLVANSDGVVRDAYLEVVEPVISRSVNVYEFDLDKARIYNVTLLYSDDHVWDNYSDEKQGGVANGVITSTKSSVFNNSLSVSGSVTTSFKTGLPFIAEGKVTVSVSGSYTHQWGDTTTESQQIGHSFNVVVKPMKTTRARGVAMKGECDVPFSYVQKDYPASGGPPIVTKLYDGVFTGANAYTFRSEVRYEDLPQQNVPFHLANNKVVARKVAAK